MKTKGYIRLLSSKTLKDQETEKTILTSLPKQVYLLKCQTAPLKGGNVLYATVPTVTKGTTRYQINDPVPNRTYP